MIITLYDSIIGLSYCFITAIFYTILILMFYADITLYFNCECLADVCLVVVAAVLTFGILLLMVFSFDGEA